MRFTKRQQHACLGKQLRDARKAAGLTQRALAARLGCAHSRIAKVELGERRLTVEEFIQLARIVKFDPAGFLTEFSEKVGGQGIV